MQEFPINTITNQRKSSFSIYSNNVDRQRIILSSNVADFLEYCDARMKLFAVEKWPVPSSNLEHRSEICLMLNIYQIVNLTNSMDYQSVIFMTSMPAYSNYPTALSTPSSINSTSMSSPNRVSLNEMRDFEYSLGSKIKDNFKMRILSSVASMAITPVVNSGTFTFFESEIEPWENLTSYLITLDRRGFIQRYYWSPDNNSLIGLHKDTKYYQCTESLTPFLLMEDVKVKAMNW